MKKTLSLALSLIMIIATLTALPFTALADNLTGTSGDCTWVYDESTKTLTIDGKGTVQSGSFSGAYDAVAIVIGDGVTGIGGGAFEDYFANVTDIYIGASVKTIGDWAFYDMPSLKSFKVSSKNEAFTAVDGVLYNKAKSILYLYPEAKETKAFTVPSSVVKILKGAFCNVSKLESISLPSGLKIIGSYAFYEVDSLKALRVPGTVKSIGYEGIAYCDSLEILVLKDGIQYLGDYAIYGNHAIKTLTVPGTAILGECAICYNEGLETLTIGQGMKILPYESIYYNTGLKEIILGEGLEELEEYAIYENEKLEKINIPDSVKKCSSWGIYDCGSNCVVTSSCDNSFAADMASYNGFKWEQTHKYTEKKVITPATLTSTGTCYAICPACGETRIETLPKLKKNTLAAKGKTVNLKYSKKAQSVKAKKAITVKKAQGKVSYKIAKKNKNFKVAKNGKITVKKGLKKGTYKVKVKVTAAGNISYAKGTKTVTVKIVVK